MEALIALFIFIAAITLNSSEPPVEDGSFTQRSDVVTQELRAVREKDVSVCTRLGVQLVERDLSGPEVDRFSAHD